MEIKTKKLQEGKKTGIVPPPDKARRRKKATQQPTNGYFAGRRFLSTLKSLGKLCAFLLVVSLILSLFVYMLTSDKFNLSEIKVSGCKEIDSNQLEEIIWREFPANILRIDLQQLKKRLEKEKWAKQVEVRRVLPSELVIYVHERVPAAIFEMNGDLMVADEDGIRLDSYDARFGKLDVPVLRGVLGENLDDYELNQKENAARIRRALVMLAQIESELPHDAKKISEVDISDPENLKVMLVDDTVEVFLGDTDYVERFRTLMNYMDTYRELKKQKNDIASIDLRFENRIIYQPRNASTSIQR